MSRKKFADGSGVTNARVESACLRAIDSCLAIGRSADRLANELDHVIPPSSGIIRLPMEDDDSLVIAVKEARDATVVKP